MSFRVLVSPTAFKGTLSADRASSLIASTFKKEKPHWKILELPVADGGDSTLDVLSRAFDARVVKTRVRGPLGKPVIALWAYSKKTAIIEMAHASGLRLIEGKNKIMDASSFGTGELIRAALEKGCTKIFIGVGGTATADGGAGALRALGLRYKDKEGQRLSGSPKELVKIKEVGWSQLHPQLRSTKILVLCDVTNPLLGAMGSARVFGPQKGATPKQVQQIEKGLRHWSRFAKHQTKNKPGAGAAGALAYGLSAFVNARLVKGSPAIFEAIKWKKEARRSSVIITGEGQLDQTSFSGKTIGEIRKQAPTKPIYVICGKNKLSDRERRRHRIAGVIEMGARGLKKPEQSLKIAAHSLLAKIVSK